MGQGAGVKQKFSQLELLEIPNTENKFWKIYNGITAKEEKNVTVFEFDKLTGQQELKDENKILFDCAQTAIKMVKQLRHPSILKYVDMLEIEPHHFMLATEAVTPLRNMIHTMEHSEIFLGFVQIAKALQWLHSHNLTYNNVHMDSIYVTKDKQMRWVFGDLQFVRPVSELTKEWLTSTKLLRHPATITAEEGLKEYPKHHIYSRDVWAFSKFISSVYNHITSLKEKNNTVEELHKRMHDFMQNVQVKKWLADAINSDPNQRPSLDSFIALDIFKLDTFMQTVSFFDDLQLKSNYEKETFFKTFFAKTKRISMSLLKKRLLSRMLTLPFMIEPATAAFMPYLLTPQPPQTDKQTKYTGLLNDDDYQRYIIPFIQKCLQSRNRSLRVRMLQTLEYYIWSLHPEVVKTQLVREIEESLKDINDDLVMSSMDAMAVLAKYYGMQDRKNNSDEGAKIINTKLVPTLHRYAVSDQIEALRSHAVLCLVKLWNIPKVNKNAILSAIHFGLYDKKSFEMKLYVLNVILMNIPNFDPRELVTVLLKMVLPLTLHKKQEVRAKAMQAISNALQYINETDLSNCNLGNVTQDDPAIAKLKPEFPPESHVPLVRTSLFQGSGPKLVYKVDSSDTKPNKVDSDVKRTISHDTKELKKSDELPTDTKQEPQSNKDDAKFVSSPNTVPEDDWDNWDGETPLDSSKKKPLKVEHPKPKPSPQKKKPIIGLEEEEHDDMHIPEEQVDYFAQVGLSTESEKEKKPKTEDDEEELPEGASWSAPINIEEEEETEEKSDSNAEEKQPAEKSESKTDTSMKEEEPKKEETNEEEKKPEQTSKETTEPETKPKIEEKPAEPVETKPKEEKLTEKPEKSEEKKSNSEKKKKRKKKKQ